MAHRFGWVEWFVLIASIILIGVYYVTSPVGELWPMMRTAVLSQSYNLRDQSKSAGLWIPVVDVPSRPVQQRRVAICLVGGLRKFELTGPSIRKYLLDVYNDSDVFIHAPVDGDVHKLTLFAGVPHLASARLFVPEFLNETHVAHQVLTSSGSPNGIQGLLQYFSLVEGCVDLIEEYEARHKFKYDWVIRTRVDGYWNAPMLPISAFNASKYHVPYGSDFGGLNDRLGIGTRETSWVALKRMILLPQIHQLGYRELNSESSFKAQFTACHTEVELSTFPFCVLSLRRYGFPIGRNGTAVVSILSKGPLNGAKCRPCTPKLVGKQAWRVLNETYKARGWIGPTDDAMFCDPRRGWERNWEQIYDTVSGPEMAEVRKGMVSRSVTDCVREMQQFQRQWEVWNAPPAESLCDGLKSNV